MGAWTAEAGPTSPGGGVVPLVDGEPPEPLAAMTPEPYRGTFLGRLPRRAGRTDTNLLVQRDRRGGNGPRGGGVIPHSPGGAAGRTGPGAGAARLAGPFRGEEGRGPDPRG